MSRDSKKRPHIPKPIQNLLWLHAGGRCEFRGCNKLLYEDSTTTDPINESNIAHIISWTESGPRGDTALSPKLATNIDNLMLMCPEHNHLIDSRENIGRYTVSVLQEMKREHERLIRELTGLKTQQPIRVIELKSMIHGQRPSITSSEEIDALFPFYPKSEKRVIDVCDHEDLETAKVVIKSETEKYIINNSSDERYAAFIMAKISLGCYLGYVIGNKIPVQTFQHFRDTEDWKWRTGGGEFVVNKPAEEKQCGDVNLIINISGVIDRGQIVTQFPMYSISADNPGFNFLQSEHQIESFRACYRELLDHIRYNHGEEVKIHLYPATPNPINFEIGKGIMKNLDPTIILYDKTNDATGYKEVMHLHERLRL